MKRRLFMLICLLATASHHVCTGQGKEQVVDSLLVVLNSAKEDTHEVNTLNCLSKNYSSLGEIENSKKYGEDALQLAEKLRFKKGKICAHINIGNLSYYQGNYPEAMNNFNAALKTSQEEGDRKNIAISFNGIAVINFSQGNYSEALENYNTALKFYREIKDSMGTAMCYMNLGNVYQSQGNYPEALESYLAALKIAEVKKNKLQIANISCNIGIAYTNQGKFPEALKALFSALAIFEEIGNKRGINACYGNIGRIYKEQNNLEKAKDYALRTLAISETLGDKAGMALTYLTIGNISGDQNNYPDALENNFKALKLFQEIGDTFNIAIVYRELGSTYGGMEQFSKAEAYLNKGLILANEIGAKHIILDIYQNFTVIYKNQKDFKNAYKYHELLFEMNDSLFNEAKSQQIEELKVQYETEKKENEIALLSKDQELHLTEIKKQKILKILFMGGLALTTLLVYLGYLYFRNYQKLKVQTMRNKIASNLHDDVGSTLTSIRLYSEIGKKQTTDPQASSVFDKIGQNAGEVIHSMSDIVWMINPKYDAFGSVFSRMENFASEMLSPLNIRYAIKKDNEVESIKFSMAERQNIFMIFKEAIHNAAKHANCKAVAIHLSRNRDHLQMNITDDGSGFDDQVIQRGNGLNNMENRAAEMHGTITVAASLGRGTSVTLNMLV